MDPRSLTKDFKEFLRCLNARGVKYLVIGGHAVGFHGHPRADTNHNFSSSPWVSVRLPSLVEFVVQAYSTPHLQSLRYPLHR
jgi:hypothetical protein